MQLSDNYQMNLPPELGVKQTEHSSYIAQYSVERFRELEADKICLQNELSSVIDKLHKVWGMMKYFGAVIHGN